MENEKRLLAFIPKEDMASAQKQNEPKPQGERMWFARELLTSNYGKAVSDEDRGFLQAVKEKARASGLEPAKQKALLEYIRIGEKSRTRFSALQVEEMAKRYLDGRIDDEGFAFQVRLVKAWEAGKLDAFIEEERKSLVPTLDAREGAKLNELLDIVKSAQNRNLKVLALTTLDGYHPKVEGREKKIDDAIAVLSG
jgi:hypothetical protein